MESDQDTSLVVGGKGFIGSRLVTKLQEHGKNFFFTGRGYENHPNFLDSNLVCDWKSIVRKLRITKIYITAGYYETSDDSSNWGKLWAANYSFPRSILDQVRELDIKVIVLGSYLQKDPETRGLWSFYTWSKECLRNYIQMQSESAMAKTIYVYLYDTYGKNDVRPKIFNTLMNYEIENGALKCGIKSQKMNFTDVEDIVDGLIQGTEIVLNKKFQEFQISTSDSVTLEELVNVVERHRKCTIPVAYGNLQNRRQITSLWECARIIPGFVPKRSLNQYLQSISLNEKSG
jgi:CDP-paratose synthetase